MLTRHTAAYRASRKPIVQPPIEVDPRGIYHSLCPLPYLSPIPKLENPGTITEQADNEAAYRQLLVQGVLAVLLPTEDLGNGCLTSLVGQILSETIIGGVIARKLSEPWMVWSGLTTLAGVIGRKTTSTSEPRSMRNGGAVRGATGFSFQRLLWSLVHYLFVFVSFIRIFITTLASCRTLPPRGQPAPAQKDGKPHYDNVLPEMNTSPPYSVQLPQEAAKVPVVAFGIWPTTSNLLEMDKRMPWLCGSLTMAQWLAIAGPGRVAGVDGIVDR